jgi:hypothetical protein
MGVAMGPGKEKRSMQLKTSPARHVCTQGVLRLSPFAIVAALHLVTEQLMWYTSETDTLGY